MAELLHQGHHNPGYNPMAESQMMQEIHRLRDVVNQQTIALENLSRSQKQLEERLTATVELQDRITG
jgi:hypothetical protein